MSNVDEHALARAIELASKEHITCNQVLYHLKERAWEMIGRCYFSQLFCCFRSPRTLWTETFR